MKTTRTQNPMAAATHRASVYQRRSGVAALVLGAACALAPALALGQTFEPTGANVQKAVNGVLALMGYMLTPDVTTGSLSISNQSTGNPDFAMTSLGAGLELDSSKYDIIVTRTRLMARYKFGESVRGCSVGLAISF
jgi:hypothetical protein